MWFSAAAIVLCLVLPGLGLAQPPAATAPSTAISLSCGAMGVPSASLDEGGSFSVWRAQLREDIRQRVGEAASLGIGILYQYEDYSFDDPSFTGGVAPWEAIHRVDLGLQAQYRWGEDWALFVQPVLEWAGEADADAGEAFGYGGIFSVSRQFGRNLLLGLGAGVFDKLEEVDAFPMVVVNWRITDALRLSNPFRAGPAGPAGLELAYRFSGTWEAGVGGAYRSQRFRLDDEGFAPSGIGEMRSVPVYARLSHGIGARGSCDLYAGALLNGELSVEDEDGRGLASDDYGAAAFLALTVSAKF